MLKFMLDTNIVAYVVKNRPESARAAFRRHSGRICISSVIWGELVCGAERSSQPERNLTDVEAMAARMEIAPFDRQAATHFGQLRAELYRPGSPIGPYDTMIAGHARALGLILVTNDTKEFLRVPGLRVDNWV